MLLDISFYVSSVLLFIMFVGLWTYADYYTKLNNTIKKIYWITNYIVYTMAIGIFFIGWSINRSSTSFNSAKIIIFIGFSTMLLAAILFAIIHFFKISHQYFRRKRNKI